MNYKNLKCPQCSGKLKIPEGTAVFKCPYCNSTLSQNPDTGKPFVLNKDNSKSGANSRKKKNRTIAIGVTAGVFLLILACAFIFRHQLIHFFTKPDKDTNVPDFVTAGQNDTKDPNDTASDPDDKYTEDVYNFLICGYDRMANLSDVNLLVSFNTTKMSCNIMQLPRDTYVSFESMQGTRLNAAFNYYRDNDSFDQTIQKQLDKYEKGTDLRGVAGLAALVEDNLCVKIHYYGIMDLNQFANIVDALGGVDMYVPTRMYYEDLTQDPPLYIDLYEGWQTLNGAQAEGVVRFRDTFSGGDISRGNVQKVFMAALFNTVRGKMSIFNSGFWDVCSIIKENLATNMTTSDLVHFADKLMTIDPHYIWFMTLPGWYYGAAWSINRAKTLEYVNDYFNIYDTPITDEQFDRNGVFYSDSEWYSCDPSLVTEYKYNAAEMVDETFVPVM